MTAAPQSAQTHGAPGRAQGVVRRIIVFVLLYALVAVAATGLSGLIERAIGAGRTLAGDATGLALSLAFTFIGGPLAGVLWWWARRRLAKPGDRGSLVWPLYLAAMSTTALIVATASLATAATAGIDGEWRPASLAAGIVWAGVWVWHRGMRRSAKISPTRLTDLATVLGWAYGVAVAATGAISALAALVSEALAVVAVPIASSYAWGVPVAQALVWTAIGALVWWWHWVPEAARSARGGFAGVVLVIVVGAAAAATLFAVGTILYVLLRLAFGAGSPAEVMQPLDTAIAAGLVGGIVWVLHARVVAARPPAVQRGARLVVSGVALIGAASGFGVVINALLAALTPALAGDSSRTLLAGGLAALVVGLPAWWLAWRPGRDVSAADAGAPARRIYLVAVFGVSAIVAIVTLLVIGFRLFEFALDPSGAGGVIERIRAPLGLLAATAVVFTYHFAVWRRDRDAAHTASPHTGVGRIVLVAAQAPVDAVERIRTATGASVTVWSATEGAGSLGEAELAELPAALEGVAARRALVIAEPGGGVRVIALAD